MIVVHICAGVWVVSDGMWDVNTCSYMKWNVCIIFV